MRQIPRTAPRGDKGRKLQGKEADIEREGMRQQALREKEKLEEMKDKAQEVRN